MAMTGRVQQHASQGVDTNAGMNSAREEQKSQFESAVSAPVTEEQTQTTAGPTEEQLRALAGSQVLTLGPGETTEFDIPGFCTDLNNSCAHGTAADLTSYTNDIASKHNNQGAIWSTDGEINSNVNPDDDEGIFD
eukprot:269573_1